MPLDEGSLPSSANEAIEGRKGADADLDDFDELDSVTGEPSLLHAYMAYAKSMNVQPEDAFGVALDSLEFRAGLEVGQRASRSDQGDSEPTASSVSKASGVSSLLDAQITASHHMLEADHELLSLLEAPAGVNRYNRGFFLKHAAAESALDPLAMLHRVMRLITTSTSSPHALHQAAGMRGAGLPFRLLEPASPELQRLLVLHAAAVDRALQPPVGMSHDSPTRSTRAILPSARQRPISALEASILGIQQARSGPGASLMPSAVTYDGMHLTMAGLCAALVAFEHGLDFAHSPRHFPILMACHTQLQTHATKMSSSTSAGSASTGSVSVSSRSVNDGRHLDDFDAQSHDPPSAGAGGVKGGSPDPQVSSHTVSLSVLFSRFPHLPRLLDEATDDDVAAAKLLLQQLTREAQSAQEAGSAHAEVGASPATGAFAASAPATGSSDAVLNPQQGLPSAGLRALMRKHLHALPQPVLQVVFRPSFSAKRGQNTLFASSGVPFECFANAAMCRVSGISAQDVADDIAGSTSARLRIFLWLDAHPKTQLARALAAIAACAAGQSSYQFEGMFLRYNRPPPVAGAEQPPLHTSSMYGVETRHMERTPSGGLMCSTSYLSDLVMTHQSTPMADMDLPGNELRTMEALLLHPERYPDLQRAMRVLGATDPATALWRSFDFSCRHLAVRALGLVRMGGASAAGPPFQAVESVIGSMVSQLLHAHVQRGGSFPPSAADIASLMEDRHIDAHLQRAFRVATEGGVSDFEGESPAGQRTPMGLGLSSRGVGSITPPTAHTGSQDGCEEEAETLFEHHFSQAPVAGGAAGAVRKAASAPWDAGMRYADSDVSRVRSALSCVVDKGLLRELAREALSQVTLMMASGGMPGMELLMGPSSGGVPPPREQLSMALQVHVGHEVVHMRRALRGRRVMQLVLSLAAMSARQRNAEATIPLQLLRTAAALQGAAQLEEALHATVQQVADDGR